MTMPDDAQRTALEQQTLTATTFVEIADILVNDFDVIDVLTQLTARCVELLHAKAAGILLADASGHLCVVGASSEQIQLLELFQLQNDEGPCLDCYTTGQAIAAPDLNTSSVWPKFAAESTAAGYRSVYAIPLHHNNVTLGCLNLFMTDAGPLAVTDVALAQALADVASIAIVHSYIARQTGDRDEQLHHALASRITIEQAKGMIAEHFTLDVHDAFVVLRSHARRSGRGLTDTADELVAGTIALADVAPTPAVAEMAVFAAETTVELGQRTVRLTGELDLATKRACYDACIGGDGDIVVIDISAVTFMDCAGYSALVAARAALGNRGAVTSVQGASGQPAYLLNLLARINDVPRI